MGINPTTSENDKPVTRYEMNLLKESMEKDSEIALLKSEQNTEVKIADVYERVMTRVNGDETHRQKSTQLRLSTTQPTEQQSQPLTVRWHSLWHLPN